VTKKRPLPARSCFAAVYSVEFQKAQAASFGREFRDQDALVARLALGDLDPGGGRDGQVVAAELLVDRRQRRVVGLEALDVGDLALHQQIAGLRRAHLTRPSAFSAASTAGRAAIRP
jgi:hypothetical protein